MEKRKEKGKEEKKRRKGCLINLHKNSMRKIKTQGEFKM